MLPLQFSAPKLFPSFDDYCSSTGFSSYSWGYDQIIGNFESSLLLLRRRISHFNGFHPSHDKGGGRTVALIPLFFLLPSFIGIYLKFTSNLDLISSHRFKKLLFSFLMKSPNINALLLCIQRTVMFGDKYCHQKEWTLKACDSCFPIRILISVAKTIAFTDDLF